MKLNWLFKLPNNSVLSKLLCLSLVVPVMLLPITAPHTLLDKSKLFNSRVLTSFLQIKIIDISLFQVSKPTLFLPRNNNSSSNCNSHSNCISKLLYKISKRTTTTLIMLLVYSNNNIKGSRRS